jgi:hypothetical protein
MAVVHTHIGQHRAYPDGFAWRLQYFDLANTTGQSAFLEEMKEMVDWLKSAEVEEADSVA